MVKIENNIIHIADENPPIIIDDVVPIIEPTPTLVPSVKYKDVLSFLINSLMLIL